MNNKLSKWLFSFIFAICLATSGFAAHGNWHGGGGGWHHGGGGGWHHGSGWSGGVFIGVGPAYYYNSDGDYDEDDYGYGYSNVSCSWVGGHYNAYGYWIPAHKVCW